jgi:hypothetical protein
MFRIRLCTDHALCHAGHEQGVPVHVVMGRVQSSTGHVVCRVHPRTDQVVCRVPKSVGGSRGYARFGTELSRVDDEQAVPVQGGADAPAWCLVHSSTGHVLCLVHPRTDQIVCRVRPTRR